MSLPASLKGERTKWHRNKCAWCGSYFRCHQGRTATCGNRCRLRLHRFRTETGFDPVRPPGDITTRAALDLLILELIRRERDRLRSIDRG